MKNSYNIVIAVCHPDDEVLWLGGLISGLSQYDFIKISVICLSGKDEHSLREKEFLQAKRLAQYDAGIVMGGPLRKATEPLPNLSNTLNEALLELSIAPKTIDLLMTHSPYGDEHQHPHHIQAFSEIKKWADKQKIPFGFFSFLPLPMLQHRSFLNTMKADRNLHIVNMSLCRMSFIQALVHRIFFNFSLPKYYLAFSINREMKLSLLNCYQSINIPAHLKGYAMSTSAIEGIYLYKETSMEIFHKLFDNLPLSSTDNVFIFKPTIIKRIYDRFQRRVFNKFRVRTCQPS